MAHKRNAQEAFGKPQARLSAFAAANLARQSGYSSPILSSEPESAPDRNSLAVEAANTPYDGIHSRASSQDVPSTEDASTTTPPTRPPKTPFSTFIPTDNNVIRDDDQCLELVLRHDEIVTLIGEYNVEVLESSGAFSIAGSILLPIHDPQRVYAPSTHPLPQIRALKDDTTIRVSSVKSGLRKLEMLSPLFRNIWNSESTERRSFTPLGSSEDDTLHRSLNVLEIDKEIDAVLRIISPKSTAMPRPRIMPIGAKSSGKSTFNRILCNYIHTWSQGSKSLYLDIDPGQPEFGPPGQVSLVEVAAPVLGPPFTHPASSISRDFRLVRSHTIAATTFKDDPDHYRACVADLIQHADEKFPIIVNSCGWVSGLGASILVELVSVLAISDIVLLEPLEDSLIKSLREEYPGKVLHRIPRRTPKPSSRTPAETRAMQTMAYFHHRIGNGVGPLRWSGKPISRVRPWVVTYASSDPGILAMLSYGQSPHPHFLAEVQDGSVVAIIVLEEMGGSDGIFLETVTSIPAETQPADLEDMVDRTPENLPYIAPNAEGINRTLNPRSSHCIGLALIRGIDTKRKELHLVTPLSESQIADLEDQQVVLVRGSSDPPEWAYLEDLYKDGDHSVRSFEDDNRPWVSEREMVGVEGSVWRMRHPPMASAVTTSR